jgi:hypothetical protein
LFEQCTLFTDNEFDLSIIIPNDLLGSYEEISYRIIEYDRNGTQLASNYTDLNYYDEGLYRFRLDNISYNINTKYIVFAIYLHNTVTDIYTRISEEKRINFETAICKGETYLTWFNYLGAWEYFLFNAFKDATFENGENKIIRRNIFNIWDTNFTSGDTQDDIISKGDNFNFTLVRSQRLSLNQYEVLSQWLKRSIKVMKIETVADYDCITENNKRTVIITPDSFTIVEGDRQYFIEFSLRDTNQYLNQIQ